MPNLIRFSGPWGYILAILALVVFFVTLRATWFLLRYPAPGARPLRESLNALLFWGAVAAILGFLGQCHGVYLALGTILQAAEIAPEVVAQGSVISFLPTLFGLGILGFSVAAWACLRLLARGRLGPGKGWPALLVLFLLSFPG